MTSQKVILSKQVFFLVVWAALHVQMVGQVYKSNCTEVKTQNGLPTLYVNGSPYPPFAYMSYLGSEVYYREAAQAGIHLYNIPAYLGDQGINSNSGIGPFRQAIWTGDGKYDYTSITHDFDEILGADPGAKVIIRIHLDPPLWWEMRNPEELCLQPGGENRRTSFYSHKWKKESGDALEACIEWLIQSDYADHLIGIHVAGGFTEEWFYHFGDEFHDENPMRQEAFRSWLRIRYKEDVAALRKAWNDHRVSFETAGTADISGRVKRNEWRDPEKEQQVLDTYRFHAQTMADHIAYFCRIVKATSRDCLLTGAFYGYHYFVTDPRRGHGALGKLLRCPDLDYLSSPNDYKRLMGEDWPPMAAIGSVKLHGKLWLAENDTRTSVTTLLKEQAPDICPPGQYQSGVWLGPDDMESSVALLWKNAGRMLSQGYGGWWFDMWGGWFSDPQLMDVLEKTQSYWNRYPPREEARSRAGVCAVVDEELSFGDAGFGSLTEEILGNRYALGKTGTPYDLFLRSDMGSIPVEQYKVVWFLGIPEMSEEELSLVEVITNREAMVLITDSRGTSIHRKGMQKAQHENKFRWTASQLRELMREAGVHIYLDTDDVLYAGCNWLCIHTTQGGRRTVALPSYSRVTDPASDQIVSDSTKRIELNLPPRSTRLLRVQPL